MAYGENMKKLSPCGDELIRDTLRRFCPDMCSLLDVGCGRGERLRMLESAFPVCRFFGVDCDSDMTEQARANTSADIRLAPAEALPFADSCFDAVLCECSLSLFEEGEKSLGEMHRVLTPGGVLVLGELYARRAPALPVHGGKTVGRIRSREEIEEMAEKAGFSMLCFEDRSGDLAAMAAQMIFDGSFCDCLGEETAALLRQVKAGYGLWIFKKEESGTKGDGGLPVAAVITAAGLSSRMGTLKALLPFGGGTILSACVENMRFVGAERIAVVTGHRAEDIEAELAGSGCISVRNPDYAHNHMFDSVCLALRALGMKRGRILITPVDVPAVKRKTLALIMAAEGDFVRPTYRGRPGHPVVLNAEKVEDILAYGGAGGLGGAVEALGIRVTDVETGDEGVCVDADTPEDYRRILRFVEEK